MGVQKAVKAVARGELDLSLLSTDLHQRSPGLQLHSAHVAPHDHSSHGHAPQKEEVGETEGPSPGKPRRHVASGDAGSAAGWVFSPEDVFQVRSFCCYSGGCIVLSRFMGPCVTLVSGVVA
jgi:hypothetical protein